MQDDNEIGSPSHTIEIGSGSSPRASFEIETESILHVSTIL